MNHAGSRRSFPTPHYHLHSLSEYKRKKPMSSCTINFVLLNLLLLLLLLLQSGYCFTGLPAPATTRTALRATGRRRNRSDSSSAAPYNSPVLCPRPFLSSRDVSPSAGLRWTHRRGHTPRCLATSEAVLNEDVMDPMLETEVQRCDTRFSLEFSCFWKERCHPVVVFFVLRDTCCSLVAEQQCDACYSCTIVAVIRVHAVLIALRRLEGRKPYVSSCFRRTSMSGVYGS